MERGAGGVGAGEVEDGADGSAEDGLGGGEFGAVILDEAREGGAVGWVDGAEAFGHLVEVLGGVDGPWLGAGARGVLAADDEAVHGVEGGELGVVVEVLARGEEDLFEDVGHEEEGGAEVEVVGVVAVVLEREA